MKEKEKAKPSTKVNLTNKQENTKQHINSIIKPIKTNITIRKLKTKYHIAIRKDSPATMDH